MWKLIKADGRTQQSIFQNDFARASVSSHLLALYYEIAIGTIVQDVARSRGKTSPFVTLESNMKLHQSWQALFDYQLSQSYFEDLRNFLRQELKTGPIYPPLTQVFRAFELTPAATVRAVIIGQDPYHQPGQAEGMCFSVARGISPPPSLRNIFSEIESDLKIDMPSHGCLEKWAENGVLLLNRTLTVRPNRPLAHAKRGWEIFTSAVLEFLWQLAQPLVFLLWGQNAIQSVEAVASLASKAPRLLLRAPHPSPLSAHRGFLGCGHFSKANAFLKEQGQEPIDWGLES